MPDHVGQLLNVQNLGEDFLLCQFFEQCLRILQVENDIRILLYQGVDFFQVPLNDLPGMDLVLFDEVDQLDVGHYSGALCNGIHTKIEPLM